jgi:hypothetical protein
MAASSEDGFSGFRKVLGELKSKCEGEATESDSSPENKKICLDNLGETIESLMKIKKDLQEAERGNPVTVVQVLGLERFGSVPNTLTKADFRNSFESLNHRKRVEPIQLPEIVSVEMEENFQVDGGKRVKCVRECFIEFASEEQACMVLAMKKLQLTVKNSNECYGSSVEFIQPSRPASARKTFRTIGNLLTRLNAIGWELKTIGAVRKMFGMPEPSDKFLDKTWFHSQLEGFKAIRASGKSLDHNAHGPLFSRKPVDIPALKAQIKTLYDEECDILIQLREFQANGIDFDFEVSA